MKKPDTAFAKRLMSLVSAQRACSESRRAAPGRNQLGANPTSRINPKHFKTSLGEYRGPLNPISQLPE